MALWELDTWSSSVMWKVGEFILVHRSKSCIAGRVLSRRILRKYYWGFKQRESSSSSWQLPSHCERYGVEDKGKVMPQAEKRETTLDVPMKLIVPWISCFSCRAHLNSSSASISVNSLGMKRNWHGLIHDRWGLAGKGTRSIVVTFVTLQITRDYPPMRRTKHTKSKQNDTNSNSLNFSSNIPPKPTSFLSTGHSYLCL